MRLFRLKYCLFFGLIFTFLNSCVKKSNNNKTIKNNTFSVTLTSVFEKNDTLVFNYEKNGVWQDKKQEKLAVDSYSGFQEVRFDFPENVRIDNIKITMSTNKKQEYIVFKNIKIQKGEKIIVNDSENYTSYFLLNDCFIWDSKNSCLLLNHLKKYPPIFQGNEVLIQKLKRSL